MQKKKTAQEELDALYETLENRPAFSYDPNTDPLFQSYRARYVRDGRRAMDDTVARSADLTGGYASSYAASAGQQRYNDYLQSLYAVLPSLYDRAADRYDAETDALLERASLLGKRRDQEQTEQRQRYETLVKLLQTSAYEPTEEELRQAGMTEAQARAYLTAARKTDTGRTSGRASGSGRSTGSASGRQAQQTPALIESIRRTALLSGKEAALRKLERAKNYLLPEVYEKLRRQYTPVSASGGGVGGGRALAYLR